jgi:hypothetical protein
VPKLKLPWNEVLDIEDLEHFSLDVMSMTAEYYVELPTCTLLVVRSSDFILEDDNDTIVVRSCSVRFIEEWPEDDDPDIEQKWQDFILVEEKEITDEKED